MRRVLLALLVAWPLAACDEETDVTFETTLSHQNGLKVGVPEGFGAAETADGFALTEAGDLRAPRRIGVKLADQPPDLAGAKQRTIAGEAIRYTVDELGAGSAGTEYRLTAVVPWQGKAVILQAEDQSEGGEPDFATAWAVLDHLLAK